MQDFENTVGFITGGASGIGLGAARALGQRGMSLVLADIEEETLGAAADSLRREGVEVDTEVLDVRDADQYREVAERTLSKRGKLNFLFNNAGVASHSPIGESSLEDWRWVVDVNLMGVIYGVEVFLPAMRASGEAGYIINTASLAGHSAMPGMSSYCATKFAVVGYSEVLRHELEGSLINVSVLCPAWVKTRIAQSRRNHPSAPQSENLPEGEAEVHRIIMEEGISVEDLTARMLEGMARGTFYLFTHPDFWPLVKDRLTRIEADHSEILPAPV